MHAGSNGQSVNVDRIELLTKLKENREKHVAEFNAAVGAYQQAMIDKLQDVLKQVKKGKVEELHVRLPKPTSYEDSYTDIIEMLEMSVDKTINLDRSSFKSYVKDEWGWSSGFKSLTGAYIGGSAGNLG